MVNYGRRRRRPAVAVQVICHPIIRIVKVASCMDRVNQRPIAVGVRPAMATLLKAISISAHRPVPHAMLKYGQKPLRLAVVAVIRPPTIRIASVASCTHRVTILPSAVGVRLVTAMLYKAILIWVHHPAPRVTVRYGPKPLHPVAVVPLACLPAIRIISVASCTHRVMTRPTAVGVRFVTAPPYKAI